MEPENIGGSFLKSTLAVNIREAFSGSQAIKSDYIILNKGLLGSHSQASSLASRTEAREVTMGVGVKRACAQKRREGRGGEEEEEEREKEST